MEYLLEWLLQIWDFMANFMLCLIRTGCIMRNIVLHIHIFLAVALIALVSGGCRDRHAAELLVRADSVMEESPDSARTLLADIDSTRLRGADLALYAVLDAQSRHKLYMEAPSDTLLNIAVDHYIAHGPDSLLMKALFYRAVGYKQAEETQKSSMDAIFAWEVATETTNHYWKAKSAELLADINRSTTNAVEEMYWRGLAASEYEISGHRASHLFSLCDLAIPMANQGDISKALRFLDSIYSPIRSFDSHSLETYYYEVAIPVIAVHGNMETGREYLNRLKVLYEDSLPLQYEIYNAHLFLRQKDHARALECISRVRPCLNDLSDTLLYWNENMALYSDMEDYRKAFAYADSLTTGQYAMFQNAMAQPDVSVQRNFYQQRYNIKHEEVRHNKNKFFVICVIFFLLIIDVVLLAHFSRRQIKKKIKSQMEEVYELQQHMQDQERINRMLNDGLASREQLHQENLMALDHSQHENEELKQRLNLQIETQTLLYRDKWEVLNRLCKEFHEINEDDKEYKYRLNKIRKYLESLRSPRNKKEIEEAVNKYMNNLVLRLREQCPFLEETEVEYLTLLYAGFSAKTIAFFTNIGVKYFYTRRERIEKKLNNSNAIDKEEFIRKLRES